MERLVHLLLQEQGWVSLAVVLMHSCLLFLAEASLASVGQLCRLRQLLQLLWQLLLQPLLLATKQPPTPFLMRPEA